VQIESAIFHCSAPDLNSCPDESLPEFAFIGRSNVGKSSLLNVLAGEQGLARVSPKPGFTKMINIFTINKNWRLVDLPGYGFAEGARKESARFNQAVSHYLKKRTNLCLVFALIESGLSPQEIDLAFVEWLARNQVPFVLVFTKTDKVLEAVVQTNIEAFKQAISAWFVQPPAIFTCSSETGHGRRDLLNVIGEMMTAIEADQAKQEQAEEAAKPAAPTIGDVPSLSTRSKPRKKGPDLIRPW